MKRTLLIIIVKRCGLKPDFFAAHQRLMGHWRTCLPLRMFEVDYEDLVANQKSVSRDLIAFCGLDWDDRCLEFHRNPRPVQTASYVQVRRPIYASSVGRWQNTSPIWSRCSWRSACKDLHRFIRRKGALGFANGK